MGLGRALGVPLASAEEIQGNQGSTAEPSAPLTLGTIVNRAVLVNLSLSQINFQR